MAVAWPAFTQQMGQCRFQLGYVLRGPGAGTGHPKGTKQHVGCRCHHEFYSPSLSLCHLQFRTRICHNFYIIFLKSPALLRELGQHRASHREDHRENTPQWTCITLWDFVCTLHVLRNQLPAPRKEAFVFPGSLTFRVYQHLKSLCKTTKNYLNHCMGWGLLGLYFNTQATGTYPVI